MVIPRKLKETCGKHGRVSEPIILAKYWTKELNLIGKICPILP